MTASFQRSLFAATPGSGPEAPSGGALSPVLVETLVEDDAGFRPGSILSGLIGTPPAAMPDMGGPAGAAGPTRPGAAGDAAVRPVPAAASDAAVPADAAQPVAAARSAGTVSAETLPTLTMDQIAAYLTDGFWADRGEVRHSYAVAQGGTLTVDMTDLGAAERTIASMALAAWTDVTGIRFDTTSTAGAAASIRMVNDDTRGAYAQATDGYYNPDGSATVTGSIVNIPANWAEGPRAGFASYYYQTWIHEIGHALGLGHAGNYNGTATYGTDNHYANDSWQATVMSYFDQLENPAVDASRAFVVTPMMADIIAVHDLYGAPAGLNGTNTTWGEGSTLGGAFGTANRLMTQGHDVTMTILDQGGTDWLKLGGDGSAQVIDLRGGRISSVYGLTGNLSIARGTVIEHVLAGSASDRVTGNHFGNKLQGMAGNDTLAGLAGNDTLEGGAGADRLEGGVGNDLYIVDAADTVVERDGEGTDRVRAFASHTLAEFIENLDLAGSAKYGTGNALANTLRGTGLANYLSGAAGDDTLLGLEGDDTLDGNAGADRLEGGAGNDLYLVNGGDTVVELAGGGTDWVRSAVSITLADHVEGLQLTGRARYGTGNGGDNIVRGTNGANILSGGAGNDRLSGNGGDDTLDGNAGVDTLEGGAGNDVYIYDAADTIIESADGGYDTIRTTRDLVLADHLERVVVSGWRAVSVTGNAAGNEIIGNGVANVIAGGGGEDLLFGGGGADVFVFTAGEGGRIGDFQDDLDVIRIDRGAMGDLDAAAVLATATEIDGHVMLTVAGGMIRIDGTTIDALRDDLLVA